MKQSPYTLLKLLTCVTAIASLCLCTSSCNKMPDGGVPIYVRVDSPSVLSTGFFGSASCHIPSVWATTGAHNLGAYEMPINIPVLSEGSVPMAVSAGIYDNGIVSAQAQYPFYEPDTFTIPNAIPGHVYVHHPVYQYYSFTQIGLVCDFENNNPFTGITVLNPGPDSVTYEGLHSGGIIMTPSMDSATALQTGQMQINTNGRECYMELNWKINNPNVFCDVGLLVTDYSGSYISYQQLLPDITLQPLGHWEKTYLNFNNTVQTNENYYFQIYFTAYNSAGQQDTVYLDNIKLLYFH